MRVLWWLARGRIGAAVLRDFRWQWPIPCFNPNDGGKTAMVLFTYFHIVWKRYTIEICGYMPGKQWTQLFKTSTERGNRCRARSSMCAEKINPWP